MIYKFILLGVCLFSLLLGYGQAVLPDNIRAVNSIDRIGHIRSSEFFYGIPLPPGKVVGDTYISTEWRSSTVLLYENHTLVEGYSIRFDIDADELEFNSKDGVKVLASDKVHSFVWMNEQLNQPEYFINAKEFIGEDGAPMKGFFQVLSDGAVPLFKKTKLWIKKADYSVYTNMGSRDDKIMKRHDLFYVKDGKVFKIPSSSKKILSLFGDKSPEVKNFMNDKSLSTSKEGELIKIFDHYNSAKKN